MSQLRKSTVEQAARLIITITAAESTIAAQHKQLGRLNPDLATFQFDLEQIKIKVAEWTKRRDEAHAALLALETAEYEASSVSVISQGKRTAQVIITTEDADGKKSSMTRHLRQNGTEWQGHSLLGLRIVKYDLNKTAPAEKEKQAA